MSITPKDWRPLTEGEARTWPKARLGGGLLALVVVTGALSVILLIALAALARLLYLEGPGGIGRALGGGRELYVLMGMVTAGAILALLIWAAAVFVLTLARVRATPAVAALGAAIVCLVDIAAGLSHQWLIARSVDGAVAMFLTSTLSMIPRWLGEVALTIGLMGYLLGGVRPNAYFRRRVAVPPAETPEG